MNEIPNSQTLPQLFLMLLGCLSVYEDEGKDIRRLLAQGQDHRLAEALDTLGIGLYWCFKAVRDALRDERASPASSKS